MKRLIEYGWDQPDTAFLKARLAEIERSPFDGTVYAATYLASGVARFFNRDCWGAKLFTPAEMAPAEADLLSCAGGRMQENFLRFDISPGNVDWFGDFTAILGNARLAARLARIGGSRGIWFDTEPSVVRPWEYAAQTLAATKTYPQYSDQVTLRGRQFMNALQQGYPGLTLVLTVGASQAWSDSVTKNLPLSGLRWGLISPFVNGLIAAAQAPARIVDGNERAYGSKTVQQLQAIVTGTKTGMLPIISDPAKYAKVGSCGLGLWMDHLSNPAGTPVIPWDMGDLSKNYYPPDSFQSVVTSALSLSDDYVWIYTEVPRWWSPRGPALNMPPAYPEAVWQAKGV